MKKRSDSTSYALQKSHTFKDTTHYWYLQRYFICSTGCHYLRCQSYYSQKLIIPTMLCNSTYNLFFNVRLTMINIYGDLFSLIVISIDGKSDLCKIPFYLMVCKSIKILMKLSVDYFYLINKFDLFLIVYIVSQP